MQTITRLSFMPARCWIAPEMPTAMYRSGATILPVCPTCQSFGTKPASTAAREAPIAAPNLSASGSRILKLSPEPMPRPPETMIFAAVSSGRSDLDTSRLMNEDNPLSAAAATFSTTALPPSAATASNPVVRTVMTLMASDDCTVASALPA